MVVTFELDGRKFVVLNGGPLFKFSEPISLGVKCETQQEVDYFWAKLSAGGVTHSRGWQIEKKALEELMSDADKEKTNRVIKGLFQMGKFDIQCSKHAAAA